VDILSPENVTYRGGLRVSRVERCVLGAILSDGRLFKQAAELRPADFALDSHRIIFERMGDLAAAGCPIGLLTVVEELERHKELQSVGDAAYVSSLMEGILDLPSIQHHVQRIREAAGRSRAAKLGEKVQSLANDRSVPTAALAGIGSELKEIASGLECLPPRFSEEALALRFSEQYTEDLRYVSRWGEWMRWDGMRWVADDTLHVFDLARRVCRAASTECSVGEKSTATRLASKVTSTAVERLATADRRHAAKADQWDADAWLLNTPKGTLDLRTGEIREHRRSDYITKITAAGPGTECPLWLHFLDRVTGGDLELQSFLQRMIGYSLTGITREHAFFFLYGTGANGKSVFLSTISGLLGDYAKTAPASSFTASSIEQHPTDMAGLRGARFVTAIETEDGVRFAEAKIKSLTGGDKIAARFMRCDFFEFVPELKLVIAGNHKPGLRSVDEAIRRRLHLVPFTVTIPEVDRDSRLSEKLRAEFPGILAWATHGCLEWQREGLKPPDAVRNATAEYLDTEDTIRRWFEECCVVEARRWTPVGALFANWQLWCKRVGEREGSQKRFTQQLETLGYKRCRTGQARGFNGISLKPSFVTHVTDASVIAVTGASGRLI
jgi:putative DNA primase/helicase